MSTEPLIKIKDDISQYNIGFDKALPEWLCCPAENYDELVSVEPEGGVKHILLDEQYYVQNDKSTKYIHTVKQLVNMQGVEKLSKILVEFNPHDSYLCIHEVSIIRNGKLHDKINTADFQILKREYRAESNIFNGNLTLAIILNDVKPGDIVDIKYSHIDYDKFSAQNFSYISILQLSYLLSERRLYLISDKDVDLVHHLHGGDYNIHQYEDNNRKIIKIIYHNNIRNKSKNYAPVWNVPESLLEVVKRSSWKELSSKMFELYQPAPITHDSLTSIINSFKTEEWSDEELVLNILDYINDNIRYLANYKATGAILPADPNAVSERGYGDCKDLSYLIQCMLSSLNIDASIILVNSSLGRSLDSLLPSVDIFDHAIVRVKIDDKHYFIDPTIRQKVDALKYIYVPALGFGLACDGVSSNLVWVITQSKEDTTVMVEDRYEILSWKDNSLAYTTTITLNGNLALTIFDYIQSKSEEALFEFIKKKLSTHFVVKEMLSASVDASNMSQNQISFTVSLSISARYFAKRDKFYHFDFEMIDLMSIYTGLIPESEVINSDFYLGELRSLTHKIYITDGITDFTSHSDSSIADDHFSFKKHVVGGKGDVTCQFEFKTLKRIVKKDNYTAFHRVYRQINNHNLLSLTKQHGGESRTGVSPRYIIGLFVIVWFLLNYLSSGHSVKRSIVSPQQRFVADVAERQAVNTNSDSSSTDMKLPPVSSEDLENQILSDYQALSEDRY